ncbi:AraC family transcriptional regulator [Vibrio lentus]|nr:AraC family transcriptional regulator [Vibrio lentus]
MSAYSRVRVVTAFDSGFNDPSYFSQRFKHHFGMSPEVCRKNNEE